MSTSSRNVSITPRKIVSKMIGQGSPESSQQHKGKINKTYLANPKIHKNKIRPAGAKFSGKAAADSAVHASSSSNRHQHSKDDAGSTCSRHADAAKCQKSPMVLDSVQTSMPVVKTRTSNNIYGTVKNDR